MKKLAQLSIENFQSHQFTQLNFSPGFNVIVGATDQGKSALIRALKWLLYNEPRGADFVRVGASQCRVTAVLEDGTRVTRERTPSRNRYYLHLPQGEEEVYEGFGNRVPWEVRAALGLGKTQLDEDLEALLNLGEQLEPPFLLAETGAVKAKAVGRLYGVHIVDAALRETVRDMGRAQQEERRLQSQLEEVVASLKEYADLPQLASLLHDLQTKMGQLDSLARKLETCQQLQQDLTGVQRHISRADEILKGLDTLGSAEETWKNAEDLGLRTSKLMELTRALERTQDKLGQAEAVLTGTTNLDRAEGIITAALKCQEQGQQLAQYYRELAKADRTVVKGEEVMNRTRGLEKAWDLLGIFQEKVTQVGKLEELGQEKDAMARQLKRASGEVERARRELGRQVDQYRELLQELGKCPLCFGDITTDVVRRIADQYQEEVEGSGL